MVHVDSHENNTHIYQRSEQLFCSYTYHIFIHISHLRFLPACSLKSGSIIYLIIQLNHSALLFINTFFFEIC